MPINILKRKNNFFATKTKIKATELDSEFNKLMDFLNNNIISSINKLISNQFIGDDNVTKRNTFLVNNGDGTTKWDFLGLDNFEYNGTSLIKFEQGVPNSILVSDNLQKYRFVTPTQDNQVLISVLNNSPFFGLINNECFTDRVVLANHIPLNSIRADNIDAAVYDVPDNSIDTIKFANACVTTDSLEDGDAVKGIDIVKFNAAIQAIFATMITSNMLPDNYFIRDLNTIFVRYPYLGDIAEYQRITNLNVDVYDPIKFIPATGNYIRDFTLAKVALNSINGNRLQYSIDGGGTFLPNPNDFLDDNCIYPEHLTDELRILLDL